MHIVDILMRVILASIGWCGAFVAGRMRQTEETWILGRNFRFTEWLLAIVSAAIVIIMAVI